MVVAVAVAAVVDAVVAAVAVVTAAAPTLTTPRACVCVCVCGGVSGFCSFWVHILNIVVFDFLFGAHVRHIVVFVGPIF